MFYRRFPRYVPVHQRRQQAARRISTLEKKGVKPHPVVIAGRTIARTFWGEAWCDNLERYSDFSNRLPRGKTYLRNGSVIDLRISEGRVSALVSGSSIYEVEVTIQPLPPQRWRAITRECAGRIDSVVELLTGRLSDGVMQVLCREEKGLFPTPREISMSCSCPDWAYLCKHLAAVLYGVGARLDREPELLFVLRGVDEGELVSRAVEGGALVRNEVLPNALSGSDLSGLFGIELDTGEPSRPELAPGDGEPIATRRTAGKRKRRRSVPRAPARRPRHDPARITSRELLARGLRRSTIQHWLATGVLLQTSERGAYLKTRETEARIMEYLRTSR